MALNKGKGMVGQKSLNGEKLPAMMQGAHNLMKDTQGNILCISTYEVTQANGVIRVRTTALITG